MIDEARRLPPSMVAVAIAFVSLFVVLASGTIVAVVADDTVEVPGLEELPLDGEAEIVDSIPTCTDTACDGYGILLQGSALDAGELTEVLSAEWGRLGWSRIACADEGELCFAEDDVHISLRHWDQVDPVLAPTFVEGVADRGLDPSRLLYVHLYRCGIIHPCK
jgi:hypothetical protein